MAYVVISTRLKILICDYMKRFSLFDVAKNPSAFVKSELKC